VVDDGGRSAAAAALLADDPTTVLSGPEEEVVTEPAEEPAAKHKRAPLFAGRRSSLPDYDDDDYAAESDDLFRSLDQARSRRVTWRVLVFLLLLVALIAATVGAVGYSARNTYFVAFEGDRVALYRGKPGGVLWFDPSLEKATNITRDEVVPALRPTLAKGKEFGSRSDAERYLVRLQAQVDAVEETTTTTTTTTTTSTTTPGATTTTVAGSSTTAPAEGP
jgi:protein phosphatase